jgi:hypothetical protein
MGGLAPKQLGETMKNPLNALERGIQTALNELPYDAFIEDATLVVPCVYEVKVSYNKSDARGHKTVVLDPATESFTVQQKAGGTV